MLNFIKFQGKYYDAEGRELELSSREGLRQLFLQHKGKEKSDKHNKSYAYSLHSQLHQVLFAEDILDL